MRGEPSPGSGRLTRSGACPLSGSSAESPRRLRESGAAGASGKRQGELTADQHPKPR